MGARGGEADTLHAPLTPSGFASSGTMISQPPAVDTCDFLLRASSGHRPLPGYSLGKAEVPGVLPDLPRTDSHRTDAPDILPRSPEEFLGSLPKQAPSTQTLVSGLARSGTRTKYRDWCGCLVFASVFHLLLYAI